MIRPSAKNFRTPAGFNNEMNLLLASLWRVEIRIEPQTITDFLKWKNRMAEYTAARCPRESWPPNRSRIRSWRRTEIDGVRASTIWQGMWQTPKRRGGQASTNWLAGGELESRVFLFQNFSCMCVCKVVAGCTILLCCAAASSWAQDGGIPVGGKWWEFDTEDKMTLAKKVKFVLSADNFLRDSTYQKPKIEVVCINGKLENSFFNPNVSSARLIVRVSGASPRQSFWFVWMTATTLTAGIGCRAMLSPWTREPPANFFAPMSLKWNSALPTVLKSRSFHHQAFIPTAYPKPAASIRSSESRVNKSSCLRFDHSRPSAIFFVVKMRTICPVLQVPRFARCREHRRLRAPLLLPRSNKAWSEGHGEGAARVHLRSGKSVSLSKSSLCFSSVQNDSY